MSKLHSEQSQNEIKETLERLGFKKLGARNEPLYYYHLYRYPEGPYLMCSCGDIRTDYMDIDFGRIFADPSKCFPSEIWEIMISAPLHYLLRRVGVSWEQWLGTEERTNKPIYHGNVCEFLEETIPQILKHYSPELIAELEEKSGRLAQINEKGWFIYNVPQNKT